MLPIDERELPASIPAEVLRTTELARALRAGPGKNMIEGLLGLPDTGAGAFDDYVVRRYLSDQFGPQGLSDYLSRIPDAAELLPMASDAGFKVSPLATAIAFGQEMTAGDKFLAGKLARIISDLIVKAVRGTGKRKICVSAPFRHGKSVMSSIAVPLWFLSNFPHLTVGLTAHSDSLSLMFSRMVRNIIQGHPEKFGFSLAADSQSVHHFHTEAKGGLWAGAVQSGILGRGCQLLIVDDPLPTSEAAASRVTRDATWSWLTTTAMTRCQDEGIVLICSTRWSVDDTTGRLMNGYDGIDPSEWTFVSLAAIAEEFDELTGRQAGEPLFPERRSLAELESFKRSMSAEAWACGFQNRPIEETAINKAYRFDAELHVREVDFNPAAEVLIGIDWNISPMSVVVGQVQDLIDQSSTSRFYRMLTGQPETDKFLAVYDELSLDDATAIDAANELVEKLRRLGRGQRLKLRVTGDASGNSRHTSASSVAATDWSNFRGVLAKYPHLFSVVYEVRSANPGVRDRVNRLNGFLKPADGSVRFAVDPRCRVVINDLKSVTWARDASGNVRDTLSKKDPRLTHASDALGYLAWIVGGKVAYGEVVESVR